MKENNTLLTDLAEDFGNISLLYDFGFMVSHGVINSLQAIEHTYEEKFRLMKNNINAYYKGVETYNKDGYNVLTSLDGVDLVQVAILALLEESKNPHVDTTSIYWITTPHTAYKVKKHIFYRKPTAEQVADNIQEINITPLQVCFKAVRNYIRNNAGLEIDHHGYSYLEDVITTPDNKEEIIYIKCKKYYDIGGSMVDGIYGQVTPYSADNSTYETLMDILNGLNLTAPQFTVVNKALQGYNREEIARQLNISVSSVKDRFRYAQKKVRAYAEQHPELLELLNRTVSDDNVYSNKRKVR